jgi:hypothetical protein
MMEQLAALVVACSMVLIGVLVWPFSSSRQHCLSIRFLPIDLSAEQIIGREPTATLPSSVVGIATVTVESANCRAKPRTNAEKIAVLYKDQDLEVLGRNDNPKNPWWYVKIPDQSGNCWLWGMTATMNGNVDDPNRQVGNYSCTVSQII